MSKEYREKFGTEIEPTVNEEMRKYCQRPGVYDEEGKPQYFTEQHHLKECDVNNIIKKYDSTGILSHINQIEAKYGDMSGNDYKTMLDTVMKARDDFNELPSKIRKRFRNNPEELLRFMEDPTNRKEAIELGLIKGEWTEETDGLGEHIKSDQERVKEKEEEEKI
jgi:phage internal scaffolding protein